MTDVYSNGQYLANNPTWGREDSPYKSRQVLRMLRKHNISPASVCDIGCGAGLILKALVDEFPESRFVGYDISPQAIEMATAITESRIRFHLGELPPSNAAFDVVLALDVFEHIEDSFSFLRDIRTLGDFKLFHVPIEVFALNLLRPKIFQTAYEINGHLHFYTPEMALLALRHAGYDVLDWQYSPGAIETPANSRLGRVANRVRKTMFQRFPELTARTLGGFSLTVLAR